MTKLANGLALSNTALPAPVSSAAIFQYAIKAAAQQFPDVAGIPDISHQSKAAIEAVLIALMSAHHVGCFFNCSMHVQMCV